MHISLCVVFCVIHLRINYNRQWLQQFQWQWRRQRRRRRPCTNSIRNGFAKFESLITHHFFPFCYFIQINLLVTGVIVTEWVRARRIGGLNAFNSHHLFRNFVSSANLRFYCQWIFGWAIFFRFEFPYKKGNWLWCCLLGGHHSNYPCNILYSVAMGRHQNFPIF